ncbi:polyribonucleotide nucleotidyltransferase ['Camptotheca acuminata' phytoplasma]
MDSQIFKTIFENNLLTVEINKLAKQTNGSVLISYKDIVILSVAVASKKDTSLDYFPLTVIYQEKFYSVGKIPGNFNKREGKPSDYEVLNSRLIDRSLRPLFTKQFKKEVQIINTIFSSDSNYNNEIFALFGSSLSLLVSDIPFTESVSAICVGIIKNNFIANPNTEQKAKSDFLLTLSGTKDSLNMIEAISNEIPADILLEAMQFGHKIIKDLCLFQYSIKEKINKPKQILSDEDEGKDKELYTKIEQIYSPKIKDVLYTSYQNKSNKNIFKDDISNLKNDLFEEYKKDKNFTSLEEEKKYITTMENIFNLLLNQEFRKMVIHDKKRVDGRGLDDIRHIDTEVSFLPRVHGSALFTRGETQSLSIVTLGTLRESKMIDNLTKEEEKRFILHYNFPHFSVGETGRYMAPSRREIGHGMLAEKALSYVLPSEEVFPYSIRVVSEILESNGSSSQATVCAASMALMDAGVPLKNSVAGVAMGCFSDENNYAILTDIQGLEDHYGDMDLKAAGTKNGFTALQMDIKTDKINFDILKEALAKAFKGILTILKKMELTIPESKKELSVYAPKVKIIQVKMNKIRDIIGPGGKIISQIIENNENVKIDIKPDGKIFITHHDMKIVEKTADYILKLTRGFY